MATPQVIANDENAGCKPNIRLIQMSNSNVINQIYFLMDNLGLNNNLTNPLITNELSVKEVHLYSIFRLKAQWQSL